MPNYTDKELTAQIEKNFTFHPSKSELQQSERSSEIRAKAKELADLINQNCPPSSEKTSAMTKLEECTFWANSSIARNE